MATRCELTGKRPRAGRNIRHKASGRWMLKAPETLRKFKPNIQRHTVTIDGVTRQMNVATSALRTLYKAPKAPKRRDRVEAQ